MVPSAPIAGLPAALPDRNLEVSAPGLDLVSYWLTPLCARS